MKWKVIITHSLTNTYNRNSYAWYIQLDINSTLSVHTSYHILASMELGVTISLYLILNVDIRPFLHELPHQFHVSIITGLKEVLHVNREYECLSTTKALILILTDNSTENRF